MTNERNIITDKLVVAKTGSTLEEWYAVLDSLGAGELEHAAIFALTGSIEGLEPLGEWNRNLLTTSYEWSRGLKERGQKGKYLEIGVSKTVNVSSQVLYLTFVDEKKRSKWLAEPIEITKQTTDRSARALWSDGVTRLSVDLYPKGDAKAQIVVQHLKLPDTKTAEQMKTFWNERLAALKEMLETS